MHYPLISENPLLEGREEHEVGADVEHTLAEVTTRISNCCCAACPLIPGLCLSSQHMFSWQIVSSKWETWMQILQHLLLNKPALLSDIMKFILTTVLSSRTLRYVWSAFVANHSTVLPHLRIHSWLSIASERAWNCFNRLRRCTKTSTTRQWRSCLRSEVVLLPPWRASTTLSGIYVWMHYGYMHLVAIC